MKKIQTLLTAALLLCAIFSFSQSEVISIEAKEKNSYRVAVSPALFTTSKLEWSAKPDTWKNAQPLKLKSSEEILTLSAVHPIVKLNTNRTSAIYVSPRAIRLQGAVNFRDLGGYSTTDGKQVKWGKIFRSADISKLTDEDLNVLRELHLKMVCDLRGEKEVEIAPDRLPEGTERILLSAGSENIGGPNSFTKYMCTPESADSLMSAFYGRTDHFQKKYKPMFDELFELEDDHALLFHCTAGKDRTGVGAALILYALGVSEEIIYKDYEATNEYRKESNEAYVKNLVAQGLSEKAARDMIGAKAKYLKITFDALKSKYGTVDLFLEKEMGITADKRVKLKEKFLY